MSFNGPQSPTPARCAVHSNLDADANAALLVMLSNGHSLSNSSSLLSVSPNSLAVISSPSLSSSSSSSRSPSPERPIEISETTAPVRAHAVPNRLPYKRSIFPNSPGSIPGVDSSSSIASSVSSLFLHTSDSSASSPPTSSAASSILNFTIPHQLHLSSKIDKKLQSQWYEEYRMIESEYNRFCSRPLTSKGNVLRLSLLPFLRARLGEESTLSNIMTTEEISRRISILYKWWIILLGLLREKRQQAIIPVADRAACLECVFGVISRPEWRILISCKLMPGTTDWPMIYRDTIIDTLRFALGRLAMKPVPVSLAVFTGSVLAYAYFYVPNIAEALLSLLNVQRKDLGRIRNSMINSTDLAQMKKAVQCLFPKHLAKLVGCTKVVSKPASTPLEDIYGSWVYKWWGSEVGQYSDVFAAFLKHYYVIVSAHIPDDATDQLLMAAPGIVSIHAVVHRLFDRLVHSQKTVSRTLPPSISDVPDTRLSVPEATGSIRSQISRMKIMYAIREIIESTPACSSFALLYARTFESILRSITLTVSPINTEACLALLDLVEHGLLMLLPSPAGVARHSADWSFWLIVMQRAVIADSSMCDMRVIMFLYTMWDEIALTDHVVDYERWILSEGIWQQLFCHWAPIVRAYYMRLLCWRVCRKPSSQAYNVLKQRLKMTYYSIVSYYFQQGNDAKPIACAPLTPVAGRRLAIVSCSSFDSPSRQFFISSISGIVSISPPRTTVVNRYDVHDEDVFIISNPSNRHSLPNVQSQDSIFSGGKMLGTMLTKRWKLIKNSIGSHSESSIAGLKSSSSLSLTSTSSTKTNANNNKQENENFVERPYSMSSKRTSIGHQHLSPNKSSLSLNTDFMNETSINTERAYCFCLQPCCKPTSFPKRVASMSGKLPLPCAPRLPFENPLPRADMRTVPLLNSEFLTYSGHALSEWALTVRQFEQFVDMRRHRDCISDSDLWVGSPSLFSECKW
ncbi:hypothetical protein V1511DRAFT_462798 [Dipodascopsis uninucleata]